MIRKNEIISRPFSGNIPEANRKMEMKWMKSILVQSFSIWIVLVAALVVPVVLLSPPKMAPSSKIQQYVVVESNHTVCDLSLN